MGQMHYAYLDIIVHNRISGVLKYIRTFIIVSLIALPLLIEAAVVLNPSMFLLIDLVSIFVIVEGVIPIITLSTYKPAIRITEHFVSGSEPNTLAISQTLESEGRNKSGYMNCQSNKDVKGSKKKSERRG